jgi:phosphocarrier protein
MQVQEVSVRNSLGLHARACTKIVQAAARFSCDIWITAKGRRASARNILAVMLLSASVGTVVRLEADGPGEVGAMREISALFQDGFGESS